VSPPAPLLPMTPAGFYVAGLPRSPGAAALESVMGMVRQMSPTFRSLGQVDARRVRGAHRNTAIYLTHPSFHTDELCRRILGEVAGHLRSPGTARLRLPTPLGDLRLELARSVQQGLDGEDAEGRRPTDAAAGITIPRPSTSIPWGDGVDTGARRPVTAAGANRGGGALPTDQSSLWDPRHDAALGLNVDGGAVLAVGLPAAAAAGPAAETPPRARVEAALVTDRGLGAMVPYEVVAAESVIHSCICFSADEDAVRRHGTCSICSADYVHGDEMVRLPCLHVVHEVCCRRWLEGDIASSGQARCPVCNVDLSRVRSMVEVGGVTTLLSCLVVAACASCHIGTQSE
jgi:hypothetical protein